MIDAAFSKDIILAFFGLFLSIFFTQGLFQKILSFVVELSHSVIPFGYAINFPGEGEKYTKELNAAVNKFEVDRAENLKKISKSISCNTAISMTLIVAATSSASFKMTGVRIANFDIIWGMFLTLTFVYLGYWGWIAARKNKYWSDLPPMSSSKYNILITTALTIFAFYITLVVRGAFNYYVFFIFCFLFTYIATRVHRIPHINITHRRAKDFQENQSYYLEDIGKEFALFLTLIIIHSIIHFTLYEIVKASSFGAYVEMHPIRFSLAFFSFPFCVFLLTFIRCVGWNAISNFIFYARRKPA